MAEQYTDLKTKTRDEAQKQQLQTQLDQMSQEQQMRGVFDMDVTRTGYDRDEYSLKKTRADADLISFALSKESVFQLDDEKRVRLEARQGRNLSHILLNSKKLFGDSKEMVAVKNSVKAVEDLLKKERGTDEPMSVREIEEIEKAYTTAIDTCQSYLDVKTTHTRSDRYQMVRDKMLGLMDEMGEISTIKEKIKSQPEYGKVDSGYSLLVLAKIDRLPKDGPDDGDKAEPVQVRNVISEEKADAAVAGLEETAQQIAKLLMLRSVPQEFAHKQGDDGANLTMFLYNLLQNFPEGAHMEYMHTATAGYQGEGFVRRKKVKEGKKTNLKVCSTMLGLQQTADGALYLKLGEGMVKLPYSRQIILQQMQSNMIDHEAVFGQEFTDRSLKWIKKADVSGENAIALRNACLKILANRTGMHPSDFNNVSTSEIRRMASYVMDGMMDQAEVKDYVKTVEGDGEVTSRLINGEETLELLRYREQNQDKVREKVKLAPQAGKKEEQKKDSNNNAPELEWTETEEQIKNLVADLMFSKNTWRMDNTAEEPGVRIQKVLLENAAVLVKLIRKPELVTDMLDKLPIPEVKEGEKSVKTVVREKMQEFLELPAIKGLSMMPFDFLMSGALQVALVTETAKEKLAGLEDSMNGMIRSGAQAIQDQISSCVDELFGAETEEKKEEEVIGSPKERGISTEEKKKRVEKGNAKLENMIKESMKGESGQGKFIKLVLKNYFSQMPPMDQRAMFASAIRDAKPMDLKLTKDSPKSDLMKVAGNYLGGIFKGAGPLLQKILQGLPVEGFPEELQGAFEDVKSNLQPIPDEIVEAQLLAMVERSDGKVSKIEVTRALGAASVGQAFLCKIYGPDIPEEGRDVVVKLLRPDVRNRMMRERDILLECASQTDKGMRKTYEGQLERIEEELDLTIEARNVERGRIYDKSRDTSKLSDNVKSMKLNNLIAPTTNSMVLEKAPGTTVDKYMKELDEKQLEILRPYMVFEKVKGKEQPVLEDGIPKLKLDEMSPDTVQMVKAELSGMIAQLQKRQKHLITLSEKWVEEGLFGQGFYHGDLHAGNIMIDDDGATVIDFGNATQLTEEQKGHVTRMMVAAAIGEVDMFRHGFHMLMKADEKTEEFYQQNRDALGNVIRETFSYGDEKSAGQRIGVVLMKAQELGLELPSAIFNFSQCQLRLQNTVTAVNKKIEGFKKTLSRATSKAVAGNPFDKVAELKRSYQDDPDIAMQKIRDRKLTIVPDSEEDFREALRGTGEAELKEFEELYCHEDFAKLAPDELYNRLVDFENMVAALGPDMIEGQAANAGALEREFMVPLRSYLLKGLGSDEDDEKDGDMSQKEKERRKEARQKQLDVYQKIRSGFVDAIRSLKDGRAGFDQWLSQIRGMSYNEALKDLRAAQNASEPVSPEELEKLEKHVHETFLAQRSKLVTKDSVNDGWGEENELLTVSMRVIEIGNTPAVRGSLEPVFADEVNGELLRKTYDECQEKLAQIPAGNTEERERAAAPFMKLYRKSQAQWANRLKNEPLPKKVESFESGEPQDFLNVMGNVVNDNVKKVLKRMGYVWCAMHKSQIQEMMS